MRRAEIPPLLRCESLKSLDPNTLLRMLKKNYDVLVSMAPLGQDVTPVMTINPPHLGPPILEVNTIWFKLWLYKSVGSGPSTLLLSKGTRLKKILEVLKMCVWVGGCMHVWSLSLVPSLPPSLSPSLHPSIHPSIYLSVYLYLSIYLCISLSIYLSVYLYLYLRIFLALCVCVYILYTYVHVYVYVCVVYNPMYIP